MAAKLIEIEQARRIVLEHAARLAREDVALAEALGRVLAEDVTSAAAVPPFDSSAMDGFALRHADVASAAREHPVSLSVVGESRAGRPAARVLEDGEAIAISTGATMPAGADAVVAVEQTRERDGHVERERALRRRGHRRWSMRAHGRPHARPGGARRARLARSRRGRLRAPSARVRNRDGR
jgi:molybdopterin molybdotransferase